MHKIVHVKRAKGGEKFLNTTARKNALLVYTDDEITLILASEDILKNTRHFIPFKGTIAGCPGKYRQITH